MAVGFLVAALVLAVAVLPFTTRLETGTRTGARGRGGLAAVARPSSRGISTESDLPTTWSASDPGGRRIAPRLARDDLGERFLASPAIARRRVFLRTDGALFAVGRP
jgi:hypothetical protein